MSGRSLPALYRQLRELQRCLPPGDLLITASAICPVHFHRFSSKKLGALLLEGQCIIVNASHLPASQRFSLALELLHFSLHAGRPASARTENDEWQANQGAAQLLVPYQQLLPLVRRQKAAYRQDPAALALSLAPRFGVSPTVLQNRLCTLSGPIENYLAGVPLSQVFSAPPARGRRASPNIYL